MRRSVIGEVADFESADKLAAYFAIVPRRAKRGERVKHGRITKQANKTGRTTQVQCVLVGNQKKRVFAQRLRASQRTARRGESEDCAGAQIFDVNLQYLEEQLSV